MVNIGVRSGTLNVGQVAGCLGVTRETVRRYIRESKLPAEKLPRKGLKAEWAVRVSDLKTFAEQQGINLDLGAAERSTLESRISP